MKIEDFDYSFPKELIAKHPLSKRDACRLLVLKRKESVIEHKSFTDILDYLQPGDCLVLNNTKVLPCRIKGKRATGGKVEVLLLRQLSGSTYEILYKPHRIKLKEKIIFNEGAFYGWLVSPGKMQFSLQDKKSLYAYGSMPLPPYLEREAQDLDRDSYQTVYARYPGAVAAPTAGLHFTPQLLRSIRKKGVKIAYLTLHTGFGTFAPVRCQDIREHKMEKERFSIPESTLRLISKTKSAKGRVIAVGTTSCRALESYALGKTKGWTDLFIFPGFKFRMVDCLLTNLHLPRTTLFLLVCAFAQTELVKKAYQEAIDRRYRFFSYGDAMLIL